MRSLLLAALVVGAVALGACDAATASPTPEPVPPGIAIDQQWQAIDGQWTFTGHVDPLGSPTDVVFEIGPGPSTARQFDTKLTVARALTDAGPLTITTAEIPDIDEICVRFSATNIAGTSSSSPLCFPHDLPSFVVDADPPATTFTAPAYGSTTVISESRYTVAWTASDTGSGIASRSLQRQVATAAGEACGAFANDGPPSTDESPLAVTDLLDGRCYQWIQTLRDHAGNTSATTSGIVRVDLGGSG
jgi:hypothetical protein